MATIDRPPLFTRVQWRDPSRALNSQPHRGSSTALLIAGAVLAPVAVEWPNPQIPRWNVELRTWFNGALPELIAVGAVAGIGLFDAPDKIKVQQMEHVRNAPLLAPPNTKPFLQAEWPNPIRADGYVNIRGLQYRDMQTQPPAVAAPLTTSNSVNWLMNPLIPVYSVAFRTGQLGTNALQLTPPPVGSAALWHGLFLGIRIGF